VRGLDEFRVSTGLPALTANGVAFVDCGGGTVDACFYRGKAFQRLGYRVMALLDNDKAPTESVVNDFVAASGKVVSWRDERALEEELFLSLPDNAIQDMIDRALELTADGLVDSHIRSTSEGTCTLEDIQLEYLVDTFTTETKELLGKASKLRKAGWFKSISKMEAVARDIVGPNFDGADAGFKAIVDDLFAWAHRRA
jgi:uncharacterized protein YbjQ (UPF0145 family)